MKREIYECDRCQCEIEGTVHHLASLQLCAGCKRDFKTWVQAGKAKATARPPRGYKRVARSCPHQVPCAEPWGCSGDEIVRLSDPRPSLDEMGY
jgi:hypothetical protein